ncbi:hypothetical protein XENOCAPTIV_002795 [Xenoophorus captivus]|uniref:Uncharacterized protein n=1 Tax=Xenoophorus captivus TaxID=1517983 RepID=A0ABV0RBL9_9TELE
MRRGLYYLKVGEHQPAITEAVQLRPDLSCLWKLLGDACTAVRVVSPSRAQVVVPTLLTGFDCTTKDCMLNQAQTLKAGARCYQILSMPYTTLKIYLYTEYNAL